MRQVLPLFPLASLALLPGCGARTPLDDGARSGPYLVDATTGSAGAAGHAGAAGAAAGVAGMAGMAGSAGAGAAGPVTWASVSCGGGHVCAATSAGDVYCWGFGGRSQLGNGAPLAFSKEPVHALAKGESVAAGGEHTCALASGSVLCWGHDEYGQNGDGHAGIGVTTPMPFEVALPPSRGLSAGGPHFGNGHTCAVGVDGVVRCWGSDVGGQIGNGKSGFGVVALAPFEVALPAPAVAVAAGGAHTCALLEGGGVWCWGLDNSGQVGDGKSGSNAVTTTPTNVKLPGAATSLAAGDYQTCALLESGEPWCWGQGGFGAFGFQVATEANPLPVLAFGGGPALAIDQAAFHGCIVRPGGRVACAGLDDLGEVGSGKPGPFEIHTTPVEVAVDDAVAVSTGTSTTCALRVGGRLSCWGDWFGPVPTEIPVPTP